MKENWQRKEKRDEKGKENWERKEKKDEKGKENWEKEKIEKSKLHGKVTVKNIEIKKN